MCLCLVLYLYTSTSSLHQMNYYVTMENKSASACSRYKSSDEYAIVNRHIKETTLTKLSFLFSEGIVLLPKERDEYSEERDSNLTRRRIPPPYIDT